MAALWAALATGVLSMMLLGDGLALNLLLVSRPRSPPTSPPGPQDDARTRAWTLVWGIGGIGLLIVPALRDAGWPSFLAVVAAILAVVAAIALGSLALHGGRTWPAVLLSPVGLVNDLVFGPIWGWTGLRERFGGARRGAGAGLRALAVTLALLIVFGALFAGADAAFTDILGTLVPDADVSGGFWRVMLLALGLVGAPAAARTAAAPVRWDRVEVPAARPRGRVEWALPLIVLTVLFAAFDAFQLAVLFGGYDAVLKKTALVRHQLGRDPRPGHPSRSAAGEGPGLERVQPDGGRGHVPLRSRCAAEAGLCVRGRALPVRPRSAAVRCRGDSRPLSAAGRAPGPTRGEPQGQPRREPLGEPAALRSYH